MATGAEDLESADGHAARCLNCGTGLLGDHCHACGQAAHVHRTLGGIGHDVMHGALHLDGAMWRTLPLLAVRPGELTRRYVRGERKRFVSPMALFLFSIFAMFTTFSILGIAPPADLGGSSPLGVMIGTTEKQAVEARDLLVAKRDRLPVGSAARRGVEGEIASTEEDLEVIRNLAPNENNTLDAKKVKTGWHRLDHGIQKAANNPGLLLYKLLASSYKFSWALIPLSLPFLWLLFFWRRDVRMYDHSVFVTYSLGFMSLLFIAVTILGTIGFPPRPLFGVASAIAAWHIYRQLRGAYALDRWPAVARAILLIGFIGAVLILFLALLIVLGLVG